MTPIAAVLSELDRQSSEPLDVVFVCDKGFSEQARKIMQTAPMDVDVRIISAGKLRRYEHFRFVDYLTTPSVILSNFVDVFKLAIGFFQSLGIMMRFRPDVVFAKGGFVCLPIGWAARLMRVPVVIHDSDARPGLTNRLLAPFATAIATGYPLENYSYDTTKSRYTGVPIRHDIEPVSEANQSVAKRSLGVDPDKLLVVATGGGLGSRQINHAMVASVGVVRSHSARAIVIAGKKHYQETLEIARECGDVLTVQDFVSEGMIELLSAADVVVTRASATSLQELAGLKKAIIVVPARQLGDQHKNAAVYREADAAIVLNDDQLEAGELATTLDALFADSDRRDVLAAHLHDFAHPDAAQAVAQLILETAAA